MSDGHARRVVDVGIARAVELEAQHQHLEEEGGGEGGRWRRGRREEEGERRRVGRWEEERRRGVRDGREEEREEGKGKGREREADPNNHSKWAGVCYHR